MWPVRKAHFSTSFSREKLGTRMDFWEETAPITNSQFFRALFYSAGTGLGRKAHLNDCRNLPFFPLHHQLGWAQFWEQMRKCRLAEPPKAMKPKGRPEGPCPIYEIWHVSGKEYVPLNLCFLSYPASKIWDMQLFQLLY